MPLFCSLGGHSVPKGTRVLVNMWAIHHDPKHWDEPEQFRPGKKIINSAQKLYFGTIKDIKSIVILYAHMQKLKGLHDNCQK